MTVCPCQAPQGEAYENCCAPFHRGFRQPETAVQLMRARYSAYVLQLIDYIVETTVLAQQTALNRHAIAQWSAQTEWQGLTVHSHTPQLKPHHAQVAFSAHFRENGTAQTHDEHSAFVRVAGKWYFIDPTVPLPSMKSPCICGSARKFKACCGQFFK